MATTTSTQDSGLLDYLKPFLLREAGIDLTWIAADTDKALEHGKNCDVDVLLAHTPAAERKMLEEGFAVVRREVMYVERDKGQITQYSVMIVNPARCPAVKAGPAKKFADWWVSAAAQDHIACFRREGRQIFFPNAAPPSR